MTNMYLDGVDDEDYEDVGGKTTFHSINSKLEAILDVMQPSVTTSQLEVEQAPPAPEPADDTAIKAKRPRAKALKKKDSLLIEAAPPAPEEPAVTADVLAETTDVGGALDFHPLVVGNADKKTFSVFELEGEPIHEEQVLDEQGPHPPEGPNHTVAPHAIVEEQVMDEMGPPSGHGKDSGENEAEGTITEVEDDEEPVFESLRDYHSSLRKPSDDGVHVAHHVHSKYSMEKNAQNPDVLPERWIPPEESDPYNNPGTEMAPRAPDEEDDEGKIECRSTGGAFGAKSGGVVIRYQYEMRHLAGPSVDDILPKLEGGITDRLLPIFFGEECREINVNDLMYEGFTERRQLEIGGLRGSGAGRALAEEIGSALETSNLRGHRRLSRVIGIDSTPKDSPIFGKDCQFQLPNIDSRCHVMEGALTLHFPPNYSVEQLVQGAHLSALNKLRESMADGTLALSHPALMDLNFLPSSYTLRPIVDSAFSGLNVGTASVKSAKPVPVGAIVGVIIPLLLLCCCGGCVFACWRKNGKSFAVPGVEINVKSRRDMDDGSDADDELEKPRNRKDKKKKKRKKKRSGSRSDGSTTDNDESTKGSLDEFDQLADGMNAARAVGDDDEKQSLLDKKSKKKKKKKHKKKKKKKKNNDDTDGTTTDEDTADEGTTDEDLGESATSLNSLEKFERLQARRGHRTTLHGSDPNIAKLHQSTIGRDSPGNLRAELSRNRRASFAGHRPADIAGLRRNSLRSSTGSRGFHTGSDHNGSFHSQGSSFHSRESRRTSEGSDSDNMSTTSHTSTTSSDGSHTSTTSSDGSHTRETNGTTTSSSDEGTTTSSDGSTTSSGSGSSDEEKEELEKRVMSTFLHHRKGVKQQMRQQGGKKKKVSKPNTRTKKNNNVMMGHVDTGDDDCSVMTGASCATEVVGNKSKPQFGRGFKPPQDDDDVSCATEAVSNRAGAGFRRPQFGGGFKPPVQDDDDVSCATEAVSNRAGAGFRRPQFGGGFKPPAQDDDDVSCATEAVSNKAGAFRRPQFGGGFKPPVPVQEGDDDDDCSVFSAMTEATEMVQNKPAVTRKPWRPAGYRAPSSKKDNDDVSVNSEATEMVSNSRGTRQGSFHGLQGISEGDSDEDS